MAIPTRNQKKEHEFQRGIYTTENEEREQIENRMLRTLTSSTLLTARNKQHHFLFFQFCSFVDIVVFVRTFYRYKPIETVFSRLILSRERFELLETRTDNDRNGEERDKILLTMMTKRLKPSLSKTKRAHKHAHNNATLKIKKNLIIYENST